MTRVIILGAGGILGQTMRLYKPDGVEAFYFRRHADFLHGGIDLTDWKEAEITIRYLKPDVILNFAGESRVDVVEKEPGLYREVNVGVPAKLAEWCDLNKCHYIHVSSQAVFSGENPPYGPDSPLDPVNEYGKQKMAAEEIVRCFQNWTIVRPTFVLGIRPLPFVGRKNPVEQMLENPTGPQVDDRWFSILFAEEFALAVWKTLRDKPARTIIHLGSPEPFSRAGVAEKLGCQCEVVQNSHFDGIAPRPIDTTYVEAEGSYYNGNVPFDVWLDGCSYPDETQKLVQDVALYLRKSLEGVSGRLVGKFLELHGDVAKDFRKVNPQTDEELLQWYRGTQAYIWELSAYHLDEGFNYSGMIDGVVETLRAKEIVGEILCVGDGIGTATLRMREASLDAVYHDLDRSKTADFAQFRFWRWLGKVGKLDMSEDWEPRFQPNRYGAIVCLDFLEHVTDVPKWVQALFDTLKPGGHALIQNAFGLGSGPQGGIPMHLERNDKYITEYTPLMAKVGWQQVGTSNWWRKPE